MSLFAGFGMAIIFVFVFMVIISGLLMWLAARLAKVEGATFTRALAASVGSAFLSVLAAKLVGLFPAIGDYFGFIVGLLVSIIIIKVSFRTTYGRALLVWIFDILGSVLAVAIARILTVSALLR